jgi:hypothetical protein
MFFALDSEGKKICNKIREDFFYYKQKIKLFSKYASLNPNICLTFNVKGVIPLRRAIGRI